MRVCIGIFDLGMFGGGFSGWMDDIGRWELVKGDLDWGCEEWDCNYEYCRNELGNIGWKYSRNKCYIIGFRILGKWVNYIYMCMWIL